MSSYFFDFEPFDREISKKLSSMRVNADDLMESFVKCLEEIPLTLPELEKIKAFYRHLSEFPFDTVYPNYMTHPVRVASSYSRLLDNATVDKITLALCHNIREAGFAERVDRQNQFLSTQIRDSIDLLTIDRSREKDRAYLKEFYGRIEAGPENLMLFKALDKLDNTLSYVQDDLEYYHAEIVLDFVCPRIASAYPELEAYLRDLTLYVWTDQAKSKFRSDQSANGSWQ